MWQWRCPSPQQVLWIRFPVLKREVPKTSGCETSLDCSQVRRRPFGDPGTPLTGSAHRLPIGRLTFSELQHCENSSKGARDIQKGNKLSIFKANRTKLKDNSAYSQFSGTIRPCCCEPFAKMGGPVCRGSALCPPQSRPACSHSPHLPQEQKVQCQGAQYGLA